MKFSSGNTYGNRYVLGDRIAIGGMGEVWKATDEVLGRVVAIKLLSPSLADQPGFTQRFREEARNTAVLSHPNIAAVYDYGQDNGASWLVMEYVEGPPLSQVLRDEGPMEPRRASLVLAEAASALQAAHDAGVIHRDVKPANIMLRRDGSVKLTDFGISRAVDAAPITRTGEVMGTAQYISPEQAMGQPVAPSSDIYSLGVVAHEMLTGTRAFDEGSPVATAMAHIHNPAPPLPSSVPEPLNGVVMACLAKDPKDRPSSAKAVADALRGVPGAPSYAATEAISSPQRTARMPTETARAAVAAGAGAAGAGAAGAAVPATGRQRQLVHEDEEGPRRRSPWVWVVPLVIVLLLLGGWALSRTDLFSGGAGTGEATPTPTVTETASPADQTIEISAADYVGSTANSARSRLEALGLQVTVNEVDSEGPAGQVVDINPTGAQQPGALITLSVSRGGAQTPTTAPAPQPTTPTATQSPGETPAPPEQTSAPPEETPQPTAPTSEPAAPTGGGGTTGAGGAGGNNGAGSVDSRSPTNSPQNTGDSADDNSNASGSGDGREAQDEGTVR